MKIEINIDTQTLRYLASRIIIQRLKDDGYTTEMISGLSGFSIQYINRELKKLGYRTSAKEVDYKRCMACSKFYNPTFLYCPFDATKLLGRNEKKLKIYWRGNSGISILNR